MSGESPRETPDSPNPDLSDLEAAAIRAFLIADVRGYTRFTQERGDEAAAELAGAFALVVRDVVEAAGGELLELRGDEALVVFTSPRQAARAAVALRERLVDETLEHPERPLTVGIGLDAGEAVAVEGGYRGGALNVAARLCSVAKAGEILASREFVHLARAIQGIRYVDRGRLTLKGLERPVEVVRVHPETDDPERARAFAEVLRSLAPPKRKTSPLRVAAVAVLAVAVAVASFVVLRSDEGAPPVVSRADALGGIDLETGDVVGYVDVGANPAGVTFGAGSLWVANEQGGSVSRVDPSDRSVVQTIELDGRPRAIAFDGVAVWVSLADRGTVARINPETNTVVQTLDVGNEPVDIVAVEDHLWVVNRRDDAVVRLDPEKEEPLVASIDVGVRPSAIAGDPKDIWVANASSNTVARIDVASNRVIKEIPTGNGPAGIAVGDGSVWVANTLDGTVSRIDDATNSVQATIPVGSSPVDVVVIGGAVWVTSEFDGLLVRIDPASNSVTETIEIGDAPQGMVATADTLWFVTRAGSSEHRGGTLRIAAPKRFFGSIDPTVSYDFLSWSLSIVTNDGLVTFKKVGGADGGTIVPDLAVSLPSTSDDGRTYTFQLRPGIRYSDGHEVRPSDVRATFERSFNLASPGTLIYGGLVGADKCADEARRTEELNARADKARRGRPCDLSKGIVVDDEQRTVTFHLVQPDPDFLYKLALPLALILPANTPQKEVITPTIPATGPYVVSEYEPGARVELARNPEFEEWSAAAQPDGYVDTIVVESRDRPPHLAVEKDEADLALTIVPSKDLSRFTREYTDRTHVNSQLATIGVAMNTRVAPFDDPQVRRAVNYAIDREHAITAAGIEGGALPTCQILPPTMPGYTPYCPYTLDPDAGRWTAPDLATAIELVDHAGSSGKKVTLWHSTEFEGMAKYVAALLEDLGFEARRKFIPNVEDYFSAVNDSGTRAQIFVWGWISDYPAPSNFLVPLFGCDSFIPDSPLNINASAFCDPGLDKLARRALDLELSQPQEARKLWTRVDHAIVDQAPWAPIFNLQTIDFTSERVGNYQHNPQWGALLSQIWLE